MLKIIIAAIALLSAAIANAPSRAQEVEGALFISASADDPFSALVGKKRVRSERRAARIQTERYVLATDDRTFLLEKEAALFNLPVVFYV